MACKLKLHLYKHMHVKNEWEEYDKMKFYLLRQYNYRSIFHFSFSCVSSVYAKRNGNNEQSRTRKALQDHTFLSHQYTEFTVNLHSKQAPLSHTHE